MSDQEEPSYLSGKWFRTRTDAQLHELIDGSFPKGKAFEGARAELDRREAKQDQRRQLLWIKLTFWTTLILSCIGIVVTIIK
jgi:hypothetical protein